MSKVSVEEDQNHVKWFRSRPPGSSYASNMPGDHSLLVRFASTCRKFWSARDDGNWQTMPTWAVTANTQRKHTGSKASAQYVRALMCKCES